MNTVVKVEHTQETEGVVTVLEPVKLGDHIRKRGEETAKGKVILAKGAVLGPIQVGLCATVGKAVVKVCGRPRVAVISTGTDHCQLGCCQYHKMGVQLMFHSFYSARQKEGSIHPKITPPTAQARAATNYMFLSANNACAPRAVGRACSSPQMA